MKILKPTCRPYPDELPLVCEIVLLQTNLSISYNQILRIYFIYRAPPDKIR